MWLGIQVPVAWCCAVDAVCILEKSADDLLYVFFTLFAEERGCVDVFCVLSFGTVGWFDWGYGWC